MAEKLLSTISKQQGLGATQSILNMYVCVYLQIQL